VTSIYDHEYRAIIRLLLRARKDAGITQQQLAAALGQRQTFVSKYELGERRLDVAEFVRISMVIGAVPMSLLRRAERSSMGQIGGS